MSVSVNYAKFLLKRYGVSAKEIEAWEEEQRKDNEDGVNIWCSKSDLKHLNSYLYDCNVQRKYRKCKEYKQISRNEYVGTLRNNDTIRIKRDMITNKKYKHVYVYINDELVAKNWIQQRIIEFLDNYLREKHAI